jgi:hypothetical protein
VPLIKKIIDEMCIIGSPEQGYRLSANYVVRDEAGDQRSAPVPVTRYCSNAADLMGKVAAAIAEVDEEFAYQMRMAEFFLENGEDPDPGAEAPIDDSDADDFEDVNILRGSQFSDEVRAKFEREAAEMNGGRHPIYPAWPFRARSGQTGN